MASKWKEMKEEEPYDGEILFIAKSGITDHRIGYANRVERCVIVADGEIEFDFITHWVSIPEIPVG